MRTHTAFHILCGVVWRDYQAQVTGGNMEELAGRMDFEFETLRGEVVQEIEEKINREVSAARPVHVRVLPREEAFRIPDLIRTKINLLPPSAWTCRCCESTGLRPSALTQEDLALILDCEVRTIIPEPVGHSLDHCEGETGSPSGTVSCFDIRTPCS